MKVNVNVIVILLILFVKKSIICIIILNCLNEDLMSIILIVDILEYVYNISNVLLKLVE